MRTLLMRHLLLTAVLASVASPAGAQSAVSRWPAQETSGAASAQASMAVVSPNTAALWQPNTVTTISQSCGLSSTMSSGTYALALWLPDQALSIRDDPQYAVRVANQGLWDATRGYNVITDHVTIAP